MKKRVSPRTRRAIILIQAHAASAGWNAFGRCDRTQLASAQFITPQSPVPIPFPQLVLTVAKFGYRRVIRKASVERRWPFRVLSPVMATACGRDASLEVPLSASRARRGARPGVAWPTHFWRKLSAVSESRAAWVIACCERSIGRNPCMVRVLHAAVICDISSLRSWRDVLPRGSHCIL